MQQFALLGSLFSGSEKPEFGKKPLKWQEDLEMYSKFLDRKVRFCSLQTFVCAQEETKDKKK